MIKVLTEKSLPPFLREITQNVEVDYAVAFWGKGATEQLGLDRAAGGRIICNLESGCTNPDEIKKLLPRFTVKTHAKLHAKLYKTETVAVVGSSNASLNGLSVEGSLKGWREINLSVDDRESVTTLADQFEGLWTDARSVDAEVAESFRPIWRRRQRFGIAPDGGSLLEAAARNPSFFAHQPISMTISKRYVPKPTLEEIHSLVEVGSAGEHMVGSAYLPYLNYRKLPLNSWLVNLSIVRKPVFTGFGRTFDRRVKLLLEDDDVAELAFRRSKIELGEQKFELTVADRQRLFAISDRLWKAARGNETGRILPFSTVMEILNIS